MLFRSREQVDLLIKSNFSASGIATAIEQLAATKEIVLRGDIVADASFWTELRQRAIKAIDAKHKEHPQLTGLDLAELRPEVGKISPEIFDELVADLCCDGYSQTGSFIRQSAHRAALPENFTAVAEKIRRQISEKPFDPPSRKQIAVDSESRQVLSFLIKQGEIVVVSSDLLLSREAFAAMKTKLIEFLQQKQSATVSDLRQALQTSRRVIVPFLEMLDAQKVTRRVGDKRLLA